MPGKEELAPACRNLLLAGSRKSRGRLEMRHLKYKSNKKMRSGKAKKRIILLLPVLLALILLGYYCRDYIYAYWENGSNADAGNPVDNDAAPPVDGPSPDKEPDPSPYPPPSGELLHIADGDYLLALVTKKTTLGNYVPADLEVIPSKMIYPTQRQWRYYLRQEALEQLEKMWGDALEQGLELLVISAYRSHETQDELFRDYASRHGEEAANEFSSLPGQSEHQLGTAVDFGTPEAYSNQAFADTPEGIWLAENAHHYGFVMSYPRDSSELTGYIYEPWHFRYIGVESAADWKESGLVLVEFLKMQEQYWLE